MTNLQDFLKAMIQAKMMSETFKSKEAAPTSSPLSEMLKGARVMAVEADSLEEAIGKVNQALNKEEPPCLKSVLAQKQSQEEVRESIFDQLTDIFFNEESHEEVTKKPAVKNRGEVSITYEKLAQLLGFPEGVEIINTMTDSRREVVHFQLSSQEETSMTKPTGEGASIKSFSID